jgi:two-component system, response regulator PdtaR
LLNDKVLPAGTRALVLEDEFLIALDLQDILEEAGATVTCLSNVAEALAALDSGAKFDFALLDVHLGGAALTSFSVAAALTERKIPFIFLTGVRRDAPQMSAYPDAPMLEKPYQRAALLDVIRSLLAPKTAK